MPDRNHNHNHDHSHNQGLGHGTSGHRHGSGNSTALGLAALLTGGFMLAELIGGLVSGSLALLADAGHMLTDFAALSLAWFAQRLARRPADWKRTYGFDRFSVLAAFVNGMALFAIAIWICAEAIHRLSDPGAILGEVMLWVALTGLCVNLAAFRILSGGETGDLNLRAAALHVAGDLLGSVAALVAAIIILRTGWTPIDPILSVFVSIIILRSAWHVVRDSGHILLEAAPHGFDPRKVAETLVSEIPGLHAVTHLHAWSITEDRPMATLEAEVAKDADSTLIRRQIKQILHDRFDIDHVTVEIRTAAGGTTPPPAC